ncbi:Transposable element tcb2 transposase [Caligus rogercresseyi]|uniref:Transposable element tcb2 transposase n=1 Tax=Caligus rogercresseyi TaxID=217165 RepID=A0A7T8GZM2_CALRO|nr:Transposable element tcb2 transposase [Caligus rogercresseyi]
MTKLVSARDVSIYTISKAVREDLGYKSYTLRVRHLLTEKQKDARVARDKLFNLDRTHNRQNTRWICQDPEGVPMVFKSKNPASVMVLGVISYDGDVMALTSSPWAS